MKRIVWSIVALVMVISLLFGIFGCAKEAPAPAPSPAPAPAPVKPVELKLASFQPAAHISSTEMWEPWIEKIEAETGGKVKITFYPGGTLAKGKVLYDAVVQGTADIGWTLPPYTPGRFTLSLVLTLPGLGWKDAKQSSNVLWDLWEKFPEMREQFKDTHVLWLMSPSLCQYFSVDAAPHVEDLKGAKIRTPGSVAPTVEALGGVHVSMPGPEVYEGFAKGVIDGDFHPWEAPKSYRWHEVIGYATRTDLFTTANFAAFMNIDSYNKLPADAKQVIDKYSGRHGAVEYSATAWDQSDIDCLKWLQENTKMEFLEWTAADFAKATEMTKSVRDKWIADHEAKGLPGQKIYDEAIRLIGK